MSNTKKEVKKERISSMDLEELAADICGIEADDTSEIDDALYQKFNITLEDFQNLMDALWPMLAVGISPITETPYAGFLNEEKGMWLAKKDVSSMFIASVIQWLGGDKLKPKDKGTVRTITLGGKPEYDITITRPKTEPKEKPKEENK